MDTFFATPTSTHYTPLSPASMLFSEDIVTPIIPSNSFFSSYQPVYRNPLLIPRVVTGLDVGMGVRNLYTPTSGYYYDSGIGENPLAKYETNKDLRFKFLDKWLFEDYSDIVRMLKVDGSMVTVLDKTDAEKNDISKDSETDLERKSDYIGREILTLRKNEKILDALCMKNNLKYFDLSHNEYFVRKAQSKYILKKLEEMKK